MIHRSAKAVPSEQAQQLVSALMSQRAYGHAADDLELIETHISWVVLSGEFAYKIKKPIKLDFLDFSTLERRRRCCELELELNRRWTPELYLDVVPITGTPERPVVDGDGPAIEYAVKMARFPQASLLSAQLASGELCEADMLELADIVADRHEHSPRVTERSKRAALRDVIAPMRENFAYLVSFVDTRVFQSLRTRTEQDFDDLRKVLLRREQDGFVRECHGDLHLGNLVRLPGGIVPFDRIEFNDDLRTIDVISDVAFLFMDLVAHGRQDLAYRFLNRYLECTGDYGGMAVFELYFVYHCLIRAKVLAIRSEEQASGQERQRDLAKMHHYCEVARHWMSQHDPMLIVMHGYSGSGKTWISTRLSCGLPAIRVRSDIERKRLAGLAELTSSHSAVGEGIYDRQLTRQTYGLLLDAARTCLRASANVILDASFLRRSQRQRAAKLAAKQQADLLIVETYAPIDVLLERLQQRAAGEMDVSEADAKVLEYQLEHAEPLEPGADEPVLRILTTRPPDDEELLRQVRSKGK
jgi:aminoglycoside phosphotransferase family enzyme/predicted kinase